jgi:Protein of unknown function (DUF1217)
MSFTPVIPTGGYAGWRFLSRTLDAQQAVFDRTSASRRDQDYFREKIASVTTSDQLLGDRRLLSVALGAFGLDADINSKAFLRRVLDDGSLKTDALANKLADKRYLALTKAFGFGDFDTPRTQLSDFADTILARFRTQSFEAAVGGQNGDMRLALNARRELADIVARDQSANAKWYGIMGSPVLREVFQSALNLPKSFAAIDIDQQLTALRARTEATFGAGSVDVFTSPEQVEKLIRLFLVRSEAAASSVTSGTAALTLLRSALR